ncbi:amidohydrolase family protein [Gordonia sp. HY442]|uniref:amidohydrolase family protein n=1 Tax=Gordonia zhenghanii TaxID=2911516 RepID=UPI001F29D23D|nr:amidohydrolase family protein [Gordonia zhenghanii]MCF8604446.1 amidohydrolase family protein [Gordonia zhenghanii]
MLIRQVRLRSGERVDVRVRDGLVEGIHADLHAAVDEDVIDASGHTVIPGLHDHHIHLAASAAAERSTRVGPAEVTGADQFADTMSTARTSDDGWVRAVGYHESVAGPLDRGVLDRIEPIRPVRVQHRTGAMWFMNSAGLRQVGMPEHPSGRLFRSDHAVSSRLTGFDELRDVSDRLCGYGVTGVTEATPDLTDSGLRVLDDAVGRGDIRQHVHVLGDPGSTAYRNLSFGPVKRIIDDDVDFVEFQGWVAQTHRQGLPVAVHCVTAFQLIVTVTVLQTVGSVPGDRVEHAAVVPDELMSSLADLGVVVVTQPIFIAERGDEYFADVPVQEQPHLWRLAAFKTAGVDVACSTDAPFGGLDPWACMRAARDRRTPSSGVLNRDEAVDDATALTMFLGAPDAPARPRTVSVGAPADLCLIAGTPEELHRDLTADRVSYTIIGGVVQPSPT